MSCNRQPNLTVVVYDAAGTRMQQEFGYARTDSKGYFALTMKSSAIQTNMVAEASRALVSSSLVLHVINQSGTTLFIDTNVLTVTPGTVQYRPIMLEATLPSGPPRGGINESVPITNVPSTEIAKAPSRASIKKTRKKGK